MDFRKVAMSAGIQDALNALKLKASQIPYFPQRLVGAGISGGGQALLGATTGAIGGALGSEEGHRLEGALRGGALGGVIGGVGGGILGERGVSHMIDIDNSKRLVDAAADAAQLRAQASKALGLLGASAALPIAAGGAGMASQWGRGRDEQR